MHSIYWKVYSFIIRLSETRNTSTVSVTEVLIARPPWR